MTKAGFATLFERALEIAARNAEAGLGRPVPRTFEIELHGLAASRKLLTADAVVDVIYISADRFYRVINVSVSKVSKKTTTIHMVVSGHPPSPLNQTWNEPPGAGPFKQVLAKEVEVV